MATAEEWHAGRDAAPGWIGEPEHALWHFSEDPGLGSFRPHVAATTTEPDAKVWAIDTRHSPWFWFPRDCPRAMAWPSERTTPSDRDRFFGMTGAPLAIVVEGWWLDAIRSCRLYAYRMPTVTFTRHIVGGYWVSDEPVDAIERVDVGDLLERHATTGYDFVVTPSLWPWWHTVVTSTLEFSGIRLRNASPEPESQRN